ncbi:MAG: 4-hydroxy-3-methylbut-2-enyl diphosphate reductase [Crocinitomicaceae bacterium]
MRSFDIPYQYQSEFVDTIHKVRQKKDHLKKDFSPSILNFSKCDILIPRHFGFCFGVKNAIEIVYKILADHPDKRIYLISEIIHNPFVNTDLQSKGVQLIQETNGKQITPWSDISKNDIVIIPAFGTSLSVMDKLKQIGSELITYDTTCPFVEKVWNRGDQLAKDGYTIIIHGDFHHEETRATFSRISQIGKTVVVSNIREAQMLKDFMNPRADDRDWKVFFKWKASEGFNFREDFRKIAVVNQTTMLADETKAIADYLKDQMIQKHGQNSFADTGDTLCYATNDNQTAVKALIDNNPDLAFVVGGKNSSNTSHLVEMLEQHCPTYFIQRDQAIDKKGKIEYFDIHHKTESETVLNKELLEKSRIAIISGASCPDTVVEAVVLKILKLLGVEDELNQSVTTFKERYD